MPEASEPVGLVFGIVSALVVLAIAGPVLAQLWRERRFIKQRDAQWNEASQLQQDQLKAIYAFRGEVDDLLAAVPDRDYALSALTLQAYDALIDTSWNTRADGGLESGLEYARAIAREAGEVRSDADVQRLKTTIEGYVARLVGDE